MDEAAKDQPQVRGVTEKRKPGRPRKATALSEFIRSASPDEKQQVYGSVLQAATDRQRAQMLAFRIWEGQSPDLSRAERLERVKRGLEAQGLSMEGVTL